MVFLQCIFMCLPVFAQTKSNLYTKPESPEEKIDKKIQLSKTPELKFAKHNSYKVVGNLDSEILVVNSNFRAEENAVIVPSSPKGIRLKGLRIGDVIRAEIPESLIAFPDSKVPVRAKVTSGEVKGGIFLGEATLEKNSKRILIEFKRVRLTRGNEDYQLSASVLGPRGVLGIEGKYNSQEPKFFAVEFLAAGAAGYADASIQRSQNVYGNYVEAPTADTVSKKALTSALSKTAERFAEKIRSTPEYSVLEGPIEIQILITEQPKQIE